MRMIRLGRTNLEVTSSSFGALPIQRVSFEEAGKILLRAVEGGINFFDTARAYTDSEEKMGAALAPLRRKIILATKTKSADAAGVAKDIETSLGNLKTDYLDLLQIHNPPDLPLPGDGTGRYEALVKAKEQGEIRFIGISSHSVERAVAAAESGLYDTVQYPFSLLSNAKEINLVKRCKDLDVGFIAMKGLGGGLIRHIAASFAFMRSHANAVPIWGIQKMEELEEFLALEQNPPAWDAAMQKAAGDEKKALGKDFCRACGYCLPCPMNIPVPVIARMTLLLGRSPWQRQTTPEEQEKMALAEKCIECGECASRCPYELDTPKLVRNNYAYYKAFVAEKKARGLL